MALPVSCAPYQCGGGGACRTSCASDADCLAPNVCMGTTCVPPGTGGAGGGGAGGAGGAAGAGGATGGGGGAAGTTGTGGNAAVRRARPDAAAPRERAARRGGDGRQRRRGRHHRRRGRGGRDGRRRSRRHHRHAAARPAPPAQPGAAARGGTGGTGCAGYVFCDDFEDGDTVGWTPSGGTWSVITDGSRVYQGGNGNSFSLAGQPTWTDQTITARVKVTQWGGTSTSYRAGIVARATDASNHYVFAIDASGALRLLKGTSSPSGTGATGTCGKVTPAPLAAAGTWYTMQMKIVGTGNNVSLTTTFNGTLIHDCQTTVGTLSAGPAGTYIYGPNTIAEFDDVRISTP